MTACFANVEIRGYGLGAAEQIITYPTPAVRVVARTVNNAVERLASILHRDQLGSVRGLTGWEAGQVGKKTERATYRPFGEQDEFSFGLAANETKGFIGERYDADAGLQYLNARYYDPKLGLFLQPDWFEVMQAGVRTNRYAYAGNDPMNASDPGGNAFDDWGMDQEEADKFNSEEAERLEAAAQKLREDDSLDGRISRFLGGVEDREDAAADRRARIGVSQAGRIRMDVGDLLGAAVMGIAPARVGGAALGAGKAIDGTISAGNNLGVKTTIHGAEKLAGPAATRGGVVTAERAAEIMANGRTLTQADGATVHFIENAGKYDIVISGKRGVITTFSNIPQKTFDKFAARRGWQ